MGQKPLQEQAAHSKLMINLKKIVSQAHEHTAHTDGLPHDQESDTQQII